MHVVLSCAGTYSPAVLLKAFLQEVGSALAAVTRLDLHLQYTGGSRITTEVLDKALEALLCSCPALQTLCCLTGYLSKTLLQSLHNICPLLATLDVSAGPGLTDTAYMEYVLQLQACAFPHVDTLIVNAPEDEYYLPDMDMSSNTGITTLFLNGAYLGSDNHWLNLPPQLTSISSQNFDIGPPATFADGTSTLPCLLSFIMGDASTPSLDDLAQLLQASPSLQALKRENAHDHTVAIHCNFTRTTIADLHLLRGRMDLDIVKNGRYTFVCDYDSGRMLQQSVLTTMPIMPGITRCRIFFCRVADIKLLLSAFPDIEILDILAAIDLDSIGLGGLASCGNLRKLTLSRCPSVNSIGLLALCMRLPLIKSIDCELCDHLNVADLEECAALLHQCGRVVAIRSYISRE